MVLARFFHRHLLKSYLHAHKVCLLSLEKTLSAILCNSWSAASSELVMHPADSHCLLLTAVASSRIAVVHWLSASKSIQLNTFGVLNANMTTLNTQTFIQCTSDRSLCSPSASAPTSLSQVKLWVLHFLVVRLWDHLSLTVHNITAYVILGKGGFSAYIFCRCSPYSLNTI